MIPSEFIVLFEATIALALIAAFAVWARLAAVTR